MRRRARIGDVFEIQTSIGLAYVQYTHHRDDWGALIRVLPGLFQQRPAALGDLVSKREAFVTFFPLQAAVSKGIVELVGTEPIPASSREFPLFRAAGFVDRQGRVLDWLLWDGQREWKIGSLTEEQRVLPIRAVWNDTLLRERIEEGWTPATDQRPGS